MLRRFYNWLMDVVVGRGPVKKPNSYFVAVREGRDKSRVEQLPDGSNVFYVDVSDVPYDKVEAYLKKAKYDLTNSKPDDPLND